jgi:hypothetical protein
MPPSKAQQRRLAVHNSLQRIGSILLVTLALAASAGAETVDCQNLTRLPETISRAGVYCLARTLSTTAATGAAITIDADDVVLDLNAHALDGSAAGAGTEAIGIRSIGHSNLTIKNGTVRGFLTAIQLVDIGTSRGHVVEGIRADRNTGTGIVAAGRGLRIQGNQVLQTGGSTSPLATRAFGIVVEAPGSVVADNEVSGTTAAAGSYAYGIHATRSDGLVIEGNQVANETAPPAYSFGIIVPFSQNVAVSNNRLTHLSEGVTYSSGGTGKYRDNLTVGVALPFDGTGTDAGNNN